MKTHRNEEPEDLIKLRLRSIIGCMLYSVLLSFPFFPEPLLIFWGNRDLFPYLSTTMKTSQQWTVHPKKTHPSGPPRTTTPLYTLWNPTMVSVWGLTPAVSTESDCELMAKPEWTRATVVLTVSKSAPHAKLGKRVPHSQQVCTHVPTEMSRNNHSNGVGTWLPTINSFLVSQDTGKPEDQYSRWPDNNNT